jgi:hypothetical protein
MNRNSMMMEWGDAICPWPFYGRGIKKKKKKKQGKKVEYNILLFTCLTMYIYMYI